MKGVHQDVLGHSVYGADHGVLYSTRTGCCPPSVSGSGRGLPFNPGSDDWICCRNIPPAYATAAMECLRAEVESFKVLLQSGCSTTKGLPTTRFLLLGRWPGESG